MSSGTAAAVALEHGQRRPSGAVDEVRARLRVKVEVRGKKHATLCRHTEMLNILGNRRIRAWAQRCLVHVRSRSSSESV